MNNHSITATHLARNLSDVLNRVQYRGERFVIERNGVRVAEIVPTTAKPGLTLGEFIKLWDSLPKPDEDFWKDLVDIQANQPLAEFPEWD
ncbi:MAG: type II toxin-antitoxin system Phd/YefM family antitoxin [Thermomicrobiales bacterium]